MDVKKYTFITVCFNTPELCNALIDSIYKNSGIPKNEIEIIVFDNSDKIPFKSNRVKVLDNTKGKIINFTRFLWKFPYRRKTENHWGSDKHCYTIQWLINHYPNGFLLLDCDTLVIAPVKALFDNSVPCVGQVEYQWKTTKRILPYICYLNCNFILNNKIKYFDNKYNWALHTKNRSEWYDTGAMLYKELTERNIKWREINIDDYILHFQAAWRKNSISQIEWLNENQHYYKSDCN